MSEELEMSFKEKVEKQINLQRRIPITFPSSVANDLDDYAKDNSNHCYWLAIKKLMDYYKEGHEKESTTKLLIERDEINFKLLSERIDKVEETLKKSLEVQENKKQKLSHFGGGRNE